MTLALAIGRAIIRTRCSLLRPVMFTFLTAKVLRSRWVAASSGLLAVFTAEVSVAGVSTGSAIQYNRDVRPILSENCFTCHGPDSAARKAGLRLDKPDGGAIVAGHPEKSKLIERGFASEDSRLMHPPSAHKRLTAGQKSLLTCLFA